MKWILLLSALAGPSVWAVDPVEQIPRVDTAKVQATETAESGVAPSNKPERQTPSGTQEFSVILQKGKFYPNQIQVTRGSHVRMYFASLDRSPAALIMEKLGFQKFLNEDVKRRPANATEANRMMTEREINDRRIAEIEFSAEAGEYTFRDPLSGAQGSVFVQEEGAQ